MPSPELRTAESTPRSLFMDALMSVGMSPRRAGRTAEGFLGRTERTPFGFLDLTPAGTPLAAKYSADAFQRGDIKTGFLEALGAIPFGIGRAAKVPLQAGERMETVMFKGGKYPEYGIIDKSDNSLVTAFGGRVDKGGDFNLEVANAVPFPREVDELLAHGEISPLQAEDIIGGPKIYPHSALLDELKLRGFSGIGNSIRSGTATKNVRGAMDAMRAASRTKPLREAEGDFTGQRITGSRTKARVSIPKSRKKAKERGVNPARDVTSPKTFKEMLGAISPTAARRRGPGIETLPKQLAFRLNEKRRLAKERKETREWGEMPAGSNPRYGEPFITEDARLHSGEPLSDVIARREREERIRGLRERQTERLDPRYTGEYTGSLEELQRELNQGAQEINPSEAVQRSLDAEASEEAARRGVTRPSPIETPRTRARARRLEAREELQRNKELQRQRDERHSVINELYDDEIPF